MKKLLLLLLLAAALPSAVRAQAGADEALGDSCMELRDTFHALEYYRKALAADSTAELTRKIADCLYLRAEYARCTETMLAAAGPDGDSLDMKRLYEMFDSYRRLDDARQQVAWGEAILRRCPLDGETTAAVAAIYSTDSAYTPRKALELTGRYLATDSACITVLRQHADALFLTKDFTAAAADYLKLATLGDSTFNTAYSLGMCYMQDSAYAEAIPWLSLAARKSGMKHWGCIYRLGTAFVETGNTMGGAALLNMAYNLMQPDNRSVYLVKRAEGDAYYKNGSYDAAIYAWETALKAYPMSLATIFNIAQAHGLLNHKAKEKEYYEMFLKLAEGVEKPTDELKKWIRQAEGKTSAPAGGR